MNTLILIFRKRIHLTLRLIKKLKDDFDLRITDKNWLNFNRDKMENKNEFINQILFVIKKNKNLKA